MNIKDPRCCMISAEVPKLRLLVSATAALVPCSTRSRSAEQRCLIYCRWFARSHNQRARGQADQTRDAKAFGSTGRSWVLWQSPTLEAFLQYAVLGKGGTQVPRLCESI